MVWEGAGIARYGKGSSQGVSSLLRVVYLPRQRPGISGSGILRSNSFVNLRDSIRCVVVIKLRMSRIIHLRLIRSPGERR